MYIYKTILLIALKRGRKREGGREREEERGRKREGGREREEERGGRECNNMYSGNIYVHTYVRIYIYICHVV